MTYLIPKKARIHDVLSLRELIEHSRDDLTEANHELNEAIRRVELARLKVGTCVAAFDSIVAIYNRLVSEYEPQPRGRR